ncbi:MAG: right-handed parallel beta-helix repeat-containing protein [Bradymonadaceae bacterium]
MTGPACGEGAISTECVCDGELHGSGYCCDTVHQTDACGTNTRYFVDSVAGDDSRSGTSPDQPWKTLAKVNDFAPSPGDQILFKRGGQWSGTLTISASGTQANPIVYGAYDSGDKPKIYGSEEITGWTQHSANIYRASFDTPITQLFVDDERVRLARYPNTGFLFVDTVHGSTQFTSNGLDAGRNYTGATWLGRTHYWIMEVGNVTASSSKTLTLDSAPSWDLNVGEGFFLMNKLEFLDQAGEWYQDPATRAVYLWTPNGDSPANYSVRGSVHSVGIEADNRDYVTIEGLHILQQKDFGISSPRSDYMIIDGNTISNQESAGIHNSTSSSHMVIKNNLIHGMNGHGIRLWNGHDASIFDNVIRDIAQWDHIGSAGLTRIDSGNAMEIHGDGVAIRYNRIIGTGGVGIFWRGATTLEYNFIQDICLIKDDGGGLYTNTSGSHAVVRHNIVLNAVGTSYGFTAGRALAEGIYIDESAVGVTVEHNTVAHAGNSGIKLHRNDRSIVRHNTIYDARQSIHVLNHSGSTASQITDNLMFVASDSDDYLPRQMFVTMSSGNATFDRNTYVNPHADTGYFRLGSYYDFEGWKSVTGQDANSTIDVTPLGAGEKEQLFYNDTKSAKDFSLTGNYRDLDGNTVTSPLTLQPFTSQILIKE